MKLKIILALIAVPAVAINSYSQKNITYFRNDGLFNQIKLTENTEIRHNISSSGIPEIIISDWLYGDVSIPVSALDSCLLRQSDVPVLKFTFHDYPEATSLWDKELYLSATLDIESNGYTEDMSDLTLQVKGRGNSTWGMPKKPMRLKFPKKTSICGMRKAKNFVLLNNYLDASLMRNAIAFWFAGKLAVPYANTIVPCHVIINGHYAGVYTLTEKIGINSTSVDIDETQGMLFELSIEFDDKYKFRSNRLNLPVMVKDPDFDELYETDPTLTPDDRLALWESDFNAAEKQAMAGKGAEAFDIESLVNYVLLYDLVGNGEIGYPKSLYIHKKSLEAGEKYYFGPAWDFDVAYNFAKPSGDSYIESQPDATLWTPSIINYLKLTKEYKELRAKRIQELAEEIYPQFPAFFDEFASLIAPAAKYNGLRWPEAGVFNGWAYHLSSYDTKLHTEELRQWLSDRLEYLRNID